MNGNPQIPAPHHITLRDLPLAARLTLALFLLSVGIGYVAALVQLHFQHASPGDLLPTRDDAVRVFHGDVGDKPKSKLEQLLPEDFQGKPFNGQGQMTAAFYGQSEDWKSAIKDRAKKMAKGRGQGDVADQAAAEQKVRKERDTERLALLAWIAAGASEKDYNEDKFCLPDDLAKRPLTEQYLDNEDKNQPPAAKIKSILQDRCACCHAPDGRNQKAVDYPLTKYKQLKPYITVQSSNGMSLTKLAQTTHVHLLGFSMLYGLTGLILAFSSYPRWIRVLLCPLPLLAQVVEIGFWWLARLEKPHGPLFGEAIVVSGAFVAVGLLLHVVLGLFNLFRLKGWLVLIVLFAATGYGGYVAKTRVIDPFIDQEKALNAAEK